MGDAGRRSARFALLAAGLVLLSAVGASVLYFRWRSSLLGDEIDVVWRESGGTRYPSVQGMDIWSGRGHVTEFGDADGSIAVFIGPNFSDWLVGALMSVDCEPNDRRYIPLRAGDIPNDVGVRYRQLPR